MRQTGCIWWRSNYRTVEFRREAGNVGRRGQRRIGDCQPRLLSGVCPSDNVRKGNVALKPDPGWSDDRLRRIVGLGRHRNNRLLGELWLRLRRGRGRLETSIQRRQVLCGLIIDDLRMVKRRLDDHPRLHGEEMT
jgi:hypothetical protein